MSRASTWARVRGKFGGNPRKVAAVVRRTRDKKQRLCDPFFALSPFFFAGNEQGLVFSDFNPTCQVSSKFIQVSEIYLRKRQFRQLQYTAIRSDIGSDRDK